MLFEDEFSPVIIQSYNVQYGQFSGASGDKCLKRWRTTLYTGNVTV